jgi:hypothetical protein
MDVCVYSVFVLSCVGSGLATGLSLVQGVLPTVYKCKITEPRKRRPRPDLAVAPRKKKKKNKKCLRVARPLRCVRDMEINVHAFVSWALHRGE